MATEVEAQIAGSVWKIERAVGDVVKEEDVLMILESMKMRSRSRLPVRGACARSACGKGRRSRKAPSSP
jgi:biotin carboxyl carrier protein